MHEFVRAEVGGTAAIAPILISPLGAFVAEDGELCPIDPADDPPLLAAWTAEDEAMWREARADLGLGPEGDS